MVLYPAYVKLKFRFVKFRFDGHMRWHGTTT